MTATHYTVLGVRPSATREEIVRAYRPLIFKNHPDRIGPSGEAKTVELNHAYSVLTDETRRRQYDRTLLPTPPPPAQTAAPAGSPAERTPGWVQPDPARTYAAQTSHDSPVPTKRDWTIAFPAGSRARLSWFAAGVAIVASGLLVTSLAPDGYPFAIFMAAAIALTMTKKPKFVGLAGVGILATAGFTGALFQIPMAFLPGMGLTFAAFGWVPMVLASRAFRTLRRRSTEARLWTVLMGVSEATGVPIFMVTSVNANSNTALLTEPMTGEIRSVESWAAADLGSWVALNSASLIVSTAPMSAAESYRWVEKRNGKLAKRTAKRSTPAR